MKLFNRIKKGTKSKQKISSKRGKGLIILNNVSEAMLAENILSTNGYEVKGVAPPPEIRKGCDLAIKFNLVNRLGVERILKEKNLKPLGILPLENLSQHSLDITREKDFGRHLMITAANMKITIDKQNGRIVNISGGGCPDVPYLTMAMVGKLLSKVKSPREIGFSLCAYMLNKAYKRAMEKLEYQKEG